MLTLNDFHFFTIDTTEDMTLYCPGGYHPTVIGDILRPTDRDDERGYRIMHKLGWGSYATVWLAQKTDYSAHFVAVKVSKANDIPTGEPAMLQAAAKSQTDNGHSLHVPTLLDHFTLRGPNGTHSALVTDIIVPLHSLRSYNRHPLRCKTAARGLTQAVVSLHAAGIVHGGVLSAHMVEILVYHSLDLHLSNVGFALPQIADQDQRDVMQDVGEPEITVTVTVSAAHQTRSLPAYLLTPCNLGAYYQQIAGDALPQVKIFDFGAGEPFFPYPPRLLITPRAAHEVGAPPLSFQCAMEACAPEMAFARVVEKIDNPAVEPPADVWALGTAVRLILLCLSALIS